MPTVAGFNLTPVKSTALQHPDAIELTDRSVVGDRRFLFVHADHSRFSGSEKAPLLTIRSRHDRNLDGLRLEIPGIGTVEGDAAPTGEPFPVKLYDRTVEARLIGDGVAEAVSSWAGFELQLVRVDPPEYAGGIHPVSLISRASVEDLGRHGGVEATPDPRRFRMTIELDDCEPYEEDAWSGRRVAVGGATLSVGASVPRCILTTLDPDKGDEDFPTLEVLATYRKSDEGLLLGVYADVERPGDVALGDHLVVLD